MVRRPAVTLFYLVLRGLDTVEDDMTIDTGEKCDLLRNFHNKLHVTLQWLWWPAWTFWPFENLRSAA
jgi:farnesyl-diphosphate farnesyltransferase